MASKEVRIEFSSELLSVDKYVNLEGKKRKTEYRLKREMQIDKKRNRQIDEIDEREGKEKGKGKKRENSKKGKEMERERECV